MKGGTQAALAIGVGYILGRRRKMRIATLLAAAAATGGLGALGGPVLRRGAKMLGNTDMFGKVAPQLGDIADTVRGDLLDAGKAAAMAAVTGRIESLTDSLHERAESLRDPVGAAAGAAGAAAGAAGSAADAGEAVTGKLRRRRPADEDADDYDEQDLPEDADEPEDEEPEAPARRRPARRSPVARAGR